jgi:hypothetical protein
MKFLFNVPSFRSAHRCSERPLIVPRHLAGPFDREPNAKNPRSLVRNQTVKQPNWSSRVFARRAMKFSQLCIKQAVCGPTFPNQLAHSRLRGRWPGSSQFSRFGNVALRAVTEMFA